MGAFVGKAIAWIATSWFGKMILEFFFGKIKDYIEGIKREKALREQIRKEVEDSMKPLNQAKTGKEIDDATKDALDGV